MAGVNTMVTNLVRGKFVVSKIEKDGRPLILENAAVAVRDGLVIEIGSYDQLAASYSDASVLGSAHHLVSPGFVNGHHHVGVTPLQLGSPDLPLELWVVRRIAGRAVDLYLDTLYSAFEMVESGVTTVQHLHGRVPRPVRRAIEGALQVIAAYRDLGMRASYSFGIRDQNRIVYEDDAEFLNRLPDRIRGDAAAYLAEQSFTLEESLEIFETLLASHKAADRIRIQLAPVNLHWCSDRAIVRTVSMARKHHVPMHMHLLETPLQKEYARRRCGISAVRHVHDLGALGADMTLGHGVWVTEDDVRFIAQTDTAICHNCSSNLRLRSGVAALNAYRANGIRVALGIDEAGLNDDRDMLQEMRLVLRLHRVPGLQESEVPSCSEVFRMATANGAMTTPFGAQIGTLEAGKAADLVLFDWSKIASPYLSDDVPVIDAVIQRARSRDVDLVMVGGEVIYRDGRFTRVDRDEAMAALARELAAPPSAIDRRNRRLGLDLLEEARRFYAGYAGDAERDPWYKPSSRI
jgi:5-methylthioadenosine/S-adenosylhomocysteine deaminase